jgi:hypothetical protein
MSAQPSYQRDLGSARAKLGHAKRHVAELHSIIDLFFEDRGHRPKLKADLDSASGYHVLRIRSVPDLDPLIEDISLLVGDVVHDLRSALDHVAWQLANQFFGGTVVKPTQIYFPICDPKPGRAHKSPSFLDPVDWLILHEFQPCKGLNGRADSWDGDYIHQLSQLQKMSNQDKHRRLSIVLLTPNAFSTIPTRFTLPPWIIRAGDSFEFRPGSVSDHDPEAVDYDFSHAGRRVELGIEVGRIKAPAWCSLPTIDDAGEVTPRVAFEELRPIFGTLNRLAGYVQLILDSV